jgi:hypothetical protein
VLRLLDVFIDGLRNRSNTRRRKTNNKTSNKAKQQKSRVV